VTSEGKPLVDPPAVGTVLAGKYRLDRRIGKGGMGVVYEARHLLLESQVAIKVLTTKDPTTITRFLNEARAAAKIRSDFVVHVSDVGNEENTPYMVMELLEGEDLGSMLKRRGRLPAEEAVDYVLQSLAGLTEAHELGIIHRDLKPGNLYVTWRGGIPDRVKIVDFGISKRLFDEGGPKVTTGDSVLGSPAYMAPEQLRGSSRIDARTDIWSAGVILYELLTGDIPFNGPNAGAVFAAILENTPVAPQSMRPELPPGLDDVVLKCLKRDPKDRYQTASELADALAPFASMRGRTTHGTMRRSGIPSLSDLEAAISSPKKIPSATPGAVVKSTPSKSHRYETQPQRPRRLLPIILIISAMGLVLIGTVIGIAIRGKTEVTPPPSAAAGPASIIIQVTNTPPSAPPTVVTAPPSISASAPPPATTQHVRPRPTNTGDPIFGRH
jgi:serine/threonine-protein kinase